MNINLSTNIKHRSSVDNSVWSRSTDSIWSNATDVITFGASELQKYSIHRLVDFALVYCVFCMILKLRSINCHLSYKNAATAWHCLLWFDTCKTFCCMYHSEFVSSVLFGKQTLKLFSKFVVNIPKKKSRLYRQFFVFSGIIRVVHSWISDDQKQIRVKRPRQWKTSIKVSLIFISSLFILYD